MTWTPHDDGWRRHVAQPDTLVVVLHGYGRSAENIKDRLAEPLSRGLSRSAFHVPDGFEAYDGGDYEGRQWFSRKEITPELRLERLREAHLQLRALIAAELDRVQLPTERLVLSGFSQGAILSLHHAATTPQRQALVLAYSGRLATPPTASSGTPIVIVHGTADAGVDEVTEGVGRLRAAGFRAELNLLDGLAHDLSEAGIRIGIDAIRNAGASA